MSTFDIATEGPDVVRLCRDCRWVRVTFMERVVMPFQPYRFAKCTHPKTQKQDFRVFVDGHPSERGYCSVARQFTCIDARYWEAKP